MTKVSKALLGIVTVATMTVGGLVAFVAAPDSAEATCWGRGNPITMEARNGAVKERAQDGACNANGVYQGIIADTAENGACAYVVFRDAGEKNVQGYDCSANNGGNEYHFNDRNGNHRAEMKLCSPRLECSEWRDIWGY